MGIFDIFKGKQVKPDAIATGERPEVEPTTKKKKKSAMTEGSVKQEVEAQTDLTKPVDPAPVAKKPRKKKVVEPVAVPPLTADEIAKAEATRKREPWVTVLDVEIDMDNVSNGAFNLDWNDYFIAKLVRAGYKGTDVEIVDQWFSDLCRNILAENYEQEQADPDNRNRKDF